jgi:hypothetical protein
MKDVMRRQGEEIIDNSKFYKNNPAIMHPESYIILCKNIPSFNKLSVS